MYSSTKSMTSSILELKALASVTIDTTKTPLFEVSDEIWRNPELGFHEVRAHSVLTSFLERNGFAVERSFSGLKTAFRATFGSGRPNVCVICEYDALPEIGHACGHNLIAEAGVAAALGVKAALENGGVPEGTLTVLGTPAEEAGGGKQLLIDNGAFDDVDVAMMVHPASGTALMPKFLAVAFLKIEFSGKAAHAAASPWEGLNALDAAVMAYNSISVLRQQMKPDWRVHGVISNGGAKPNVIPEKSVLEYMIRAPDRIELKLLVGRVRSCFEAAAMATGCQVDIRNSAPSYDNLVSNEVLASLFAENLKYFNVPFAKTTKLSGSTDMGNVSHVVPAIHPKYAIGSGKESIHTRSFTNLTNTPSSHESTLTVAKCMAHTCLDVLTSAKVLQEVRDAFEFDTGTAV
jgi:amidohydrolase